MTRTNRTRRIIVCGVAALAIAGLVGLGAAPANAASADDGWIRIGHLSPDTRAVDVALTPASAGSPVLDLHDVSYGEVSPYTAVPAGDYELTMVPAGSPDGTSPAISTEPTITAGQATTVVAYGLNESLRTTVFVDDLSGPATGEARIRVIQASTRVKDLDVATTTGVPIATDAKAGSASAYADVPVGPWNLMVTAPSASYDTSVTLAPGTVNTLFVLDNASGGLTITSVLDSSGAGDAPDGSLDTGGGGLRDAGGAGTFASTTDAARHAADADPFAAIGRFVTGLVQAAAAALRS
ncbi:DUF4397 domain-containing protein [Leifsonia sp. Leaf264]|uniref:DUF4397 domain-containing protein n=1 Tax=Leifsonia sp. Leaf264 TaxID=1736314 RepID=UPI000AB8D45C|nr:DUF4397 domain-containing protein [Leifsonia sp. Leaf264]